MGAAPHPRAERPLRPSGAHGRPIRLLVVDDSIVVRTIITRMLAAYPDFDVAGAAGNVEQALDILGRTRVDIILLDLQMPGRDGLSALPALLERGGGARILIVSSFCESGASATVHALTLGAADTLLKPSTANIGSPFADTLASRLRRIGHAPAAERDRAVREVAMQESLVLPTVAGRSGPIGCLALGASTGGLHALSGFFQALPARFDVPILVTQHLPAPFMPYFAGQLREIARRPVRVAEDGMALVPGEIIIASGEGHLTIEGVPGAARIAIDRSPAPSGCLPSVDPMFASVAECFGGTGVAVVLSGMGRDGAIGARRLSDAGGEILVQDAASSVIWGMPGAVARSGIAALIAPPPAIAARLIQRIGRTTWN